MRIATPCENRAFRLPVAASLAAVISLGLFMFMQEMIRNDFSAPDSAVVVGPIIFGERSVSPPPESVHHTPPEPIKKPTLEPTTRMAPDIPDTPAPPAGVGVLGPSMAPPLITSGPGKPGVEYHGGGGTGSGAAVPRQTIPPLYPLAAEREGIQGYVLLAFTVTRNGTVIDARVIESRPARVFDNAALKAIYRWRFKPALDAGVPVRSQLVQRIDFRLSQP